MFKSVLKTLGFRGHGSVLLSPLAGKVIPLSDVHDPMFSSGSLGEGVAIEPTGGKVVAPSDSKVKAIFPSGHAVALHTNEGLDVLVHIGLDTEKLEGRHFTVHAAVGDSVKRGDVLIEFDRDAIKREGYDLTAPILICNSAEYSCIKGEVGDTVGELEKLLTARE